MIRDAVCFLLEDISGGTDDELGLQPQDGLVSDCALQLSEGMLLVTGRESCRSSV